jgi:hypothetical protein
MKNKNKVCKALQYILRLTSKSADKIGNAFRIPFNKLKNS